MKRESTAASSNWVKGTFGHVHWLNSSFLIATGLIALIGTPLYAYFVGFSFSVVGVFAFYLAATGFSITAGYHRLFAHRSYEANVGVKLFYLLFGAAAFQGLALTWASDHRYHHRFVDGEEDPYSIRKGFFHAHIGWLLFKRPNRSSTASAADLARDPLLRWQHRFYYPLAIVVGGILPLVIGVLLGNAWGCLLLAGVTRTVVLHHSTFFINSLCHIVGRQPYTRANSSRDSAFVALVTFGEGYHNFHHRFQYDYRNGVRWCHFDPSKWLIRTLAAVGLARHLRRASDVHIFKSQLDVQKEEVEKRLASVASDHRNVLEQRIHSRYSSLLAAYRHWRELKTEYRRSKSGRRGRIIKALKEDLARARSRLSETRDSWLLLRWRLPASGLATVQSVAKDGNRDG